MISILLVTACIKVLFSDWVIASAQDFLSSKSPEP